MAQKTKTCLSCRELFVARRDAKTCSVRCRKRLQRAVLLLQGADREATGFIDADIWSSAIEVLTNQGMAKKGARQ
jgi:hypothetical protein